MGHALGSSVTVFGVGQSRALQGVTRPEGSLTVRLGPRWAEHVLCCHQLGWDHCCVGTAVNILRDAQVSFQGAHVICSTWGLS